MNLFFKISGYVAVFWGLSLWIIYPLADPIIAGGHPEDVLPWARDVFFMDLMVGTITFGVILFWYIKWDEKLKVNKENAKE